MKNSPVEAFSQAAEVQRPEAISPGFYRRFGKRTFDILFAVALLPIIAPVVAVLWAIVRLDGGPGFFGHTRIGKDGHSFKCWKVRSMVVNAEARLVEYLRDHPEAAAEWQRDYKLAKDPRITRLGDFIRKTSLDELPQIWNVLTGEMSFVGPRPIVEDELTRYGAYRDAYLSAKPGITGLWQVSGRNDISYSERVAMDGDYQDRLSLGLDVVTILKTAGAVLNRTGK